MTLREFHNGLRLLLNIDKHELVAAGVIEADDDDGWVEFRDDPHIWFICASDVMADKLWALMQTRMK